MLTLLMSLFTIPMVNTFIVLNKVEKRNSILRRDMKDFLKIIFPQAKIHYLWLTAN